MKYIFFFVLPVLAGMLLLSGCASNEPADEAYILALDEMLEEDGRNPDFNYISAFIQGEFSAKRWEHITEDIGEKYSLPVYSYTDEDIQQTGAYGKEHLDEEGIYVYITDTAYTEDTASFQLEKYYTLPEYEATGAELDMEKNDGRWEILSHETEWKGTPE